MEDDKETNQADSVILEKKARYYFDNKIVVHISYNNGKSWARGIIQELSSEFLIIDERVQGRLVLFFAEMQSITMFQPRKKKNIKVGKDEMPEM